ncbi:hypothetical protein TNCV_1532241 [Trichonephila clavipes]|nr:hypothetical protein TNCV_1532241 [Trichonephila clavipes]
MDIFFRDIVERLDCGVYPLCMIVGSSGQGMVLPPEDRVPGGLVAILRGKTAVFGVRLWRLRIASWRLPVLRLRLKCKL